MKIANCGLALILLLSVSTLQAGTVIFEDAIAGYPLNSVYTVSNPNVTYSQNNGGTTNIVKDDFAGWVASPGDEFVPLTSGSHSAYSTLAVNSVVTAQYGQVFLRLGKHTPVTSYTRFVLSNVTNPSLPDSYGALSTAGIDLIIDPGANLLYYSNAGLGDSSVNVPADALFNLTINYDLVAHTYDVWLDSTQVLSGIGFEATSFGSTANSIAVGGAYFSGNGEGTILDQWYWQSDATTAYTTFGTALPVPEPGSIYLGLFAAMFLAAGAIHKRRADLARCE